MSALSIAVTTIFSAILTVVWYWMKERSTAKSRVSDASGDEGITDVKLVVLSPDVAAQVFRRVNGSYGYYYLNRVESMSGKLHWCRPPNIGPGSAFDTAEKAEKYARARVETGPDEQIQDAG